MEVNGQSGQSLVQVLVAVGIMGIVVAAMTSFQVQMSRESGAIAEKMAALDLQRELGVALADGTVCAYVLNNPAPLTFNATLVTPTTPQTIAVNRPIYNKIEGGVPGLVVAQLNQPSALTSSLIVTSINLVVRAGAGTTFTGAWQVGFDNTRLKRAIRPAEVSTTLTVDLTNPAAARITGCQGNSPGGGGGGNFQTGMVCGMRSASCSYAGPIQYGLNIACEGQQVTAACVYTTPDEYQSGGWFLDPSSINCPAGFTGFAFNGANSANYMLSCIKQ